jgi:3-oxoacyl-(acyl-carrier-protein) synthase
MTRQVVVTGLGAVNAAGTGAEASWQRLLAGTTCLSAISRFDARGFPVQVAGEAAGFDAAAHVPRRFLVKTDRFTHLAFAAVGEALSGAGLDPERVDRTRTGVFFGNNTGGWDLCERGFDEYYTQSPDMVNPWQATAWFLAAPQGFLTIRYGLRGMSKSFSGDRASGAVAVYYGSRAIEWDRNDVVLGGGCEAPITPLSLLSFHASGALSPDGSYRPFDAGACGLAIGEGAGALVLEEAGHARARGAAALATVLGGANGTVRAADPASYAAIVSRALHDADCEPADIDLVLCDGSGDVAGDRFEAAAIASVFAASGGVPVRVPKAAYGHLFGGAFGTDVVYGLLAARDDVLPPSAGFRSGDLPEGFAMAAAAQPGTVRRFMVTSYSRYGSCVAMIFGA